MSPIQDLRHQLAVVEHTLERTTDPGEIELLAELPRMITAALAEGEGAAP